MSAFIFEVHSYPRVDFISPLKSVHTEVEGDNIIMKVRIGGENVLSIPVIDGERYCISRESYSLEVIKLKEPYDERMKLFWRQGFTHKNFRVYEENVEVENTQRKVSLKGLACFGVNVYEKKGSPLRATIDKRCKWSIRNGADLLLLEEKLYEFISEVQYFPDDINDLLVILEKLIGKATIYSPNINKRAWFFRDGDRFVTIEYNYKMKSYSGVTNLKTSDRETLYLDEKALKKVKLIEV